MASPEFLSGKIGYVEIDIEDEGLTRYPFSKWSFPVRAEFIKRNNFMSEGYQEGISGFKSGKVNISGPFALGVPPLQAGETYTFVLGIDEEGPYEWQVTAHVSDITPSNDSESAPDLELGCDSIGAFTIVTPSDV